MSRSQRIIVSFLLSVFVLLGLLGFTWALEAIMWTWDVFNFDRHWRPVVAFCFLWSLVHIFYDPDKGRPQ